MRCSFGVLLALLALTASVMGASEFEKAASAELGKFGINDKVMIGASVVDKVAYSSGEIQKYIGEQLKGASQALAYAKAGLDKMKAYQKEESAQTKAGEEIAKNSAGAQKAFSKTGEEIAKKSAEAQKEVQKRVQTIVGGDKAVSFAAKGDASAAGGDWKKFVPSCVNFAAKEDPVANAQGGLPGENGGPCGKTAYKDFGDCKSKDAKCVAVSPSAWSPKKCLGKGQAVVHVTSIEQKKFLGMDLPGQGLDGGYPIKQWEGPGAAFDKGVTSGGSFGAKGMDGGFPVGKYDGLNNKAKDDGSDFLAEAKKFAQKYMGKTADAGSKYVKEFSGKNMAAEKSDAKPGESHGPCGATKFLDFGKCKAAGDECHKIPMHKTIGDLGVDQLIPGICLPKGSSLMQPAVENKKKSTSGDWQKYVPNNAVENKASAAAGSFDWQKFVPSVQNSAEQISVHAQDAADAAHMVAEQAKEAAQKLHEQLMGAADELQSAAEELKKEAASSFGGLGNSAPQEIENAAVKKEEEESIVEPSGGSLAEAPPTSTSSIAWTVVTMIALVVAGAVYFKRRHSFNDGYESVPTTSIA